MDRSRFFVTLFLSLMLLGCSGGKETETDLSDQNDNASEENDSQQENSQPVAVNDSYSRPSGSRIYLNFGDLLSNDSDQDDDNLLIVHTQNIQGGAAIIDQNNSRIEFVPGTGFTGIASFSYTISDGVEEAQAIVYIDIIAYYELSVTNGSGTGSYEEGDEVSIVAIDANPGYRFAGWIGDTGTINNIYEQSTAIVIPDNDINVIAIYSPLAGDTEPPTPPTSLNQISAGSTSISFSWHGATDNVGVTGYRVFLNTQLNSEISQTTQTITGLDPETEYQITISVRDAADNWSAQSSPLIITTASAASTSLKTYFFGHSLVNHEPPAIPTPSNETSIPHWLFALSQAAGYDYEIDGQYGFLRNHDDFPPRPQWGFDIAPSAWQTSFAYTNYDAVILTPANFIQYQPSTADYYNEAISPLEVTLRIVDYSLEQIPNTTFYIYENWPDMSYIDGGNFPVSAAGLARYHADTQANFHDWHIEYHDLIMAARPDANVRMIPVGPILAKLLSNPALSLDQIPVADLYEDNAPHGRPTIYFLAALVHYIALYEEKGPIGFQVPNTVHQNVHDNYQAIVDSIWNELSNFTDGNGNSRVW